jgi:cytochrome b
LTGEEYYDLHLQAGYAVLGLVCLRLAWGLLGSRHARFSDFVYSPRDTITYLLSLLRGQAKRYIGHNPAGGAMVLLMLAGLVTVTVSGIALDGAENWSGPMAEMQLFHHTGLIKRIHSLSTDVLLVAVGLHLLGVTFTSLLHRENLVKSMITGRKRDS